MDSHALKQGRNRALCLTLAAVLLPSVVACSKKAPPPAATSVSLHEALRTFREGDEGAAVAMLKGLAEADHSPRGDEASLALGNLLARQHKHAEALPYLERAASGSAAPRYALLILARSVVEGEFQDRYGAIEDQLLAFEREDRAAAAGQPATSGYVKQEVRYLVTRLQQLRQRWQAVADSSGVLLSSWPQSRHANEARWLQAEALRQLGRVPEAHAVYVAIWNESPGSPWAKQAHAGLLKFEQERGLVRPRLAAEDHYTFLQALRKAGLHEEALEEIEAYLQRPDATKKDGALLLRASSLATQRKYAACVETVERLRWTHPRSPHVPAAGITAIRALRHVPDEAGVRRWSTWVHDTFRDRPQAAEALYNLGVFLYNEDKEDEGSAVLEQLVSEYPRSDNGDDALWKLSWSRRRTGRTADAVVTLDQLLTTYPESGFRKAALYWIARFTADRDRARAVEAYQTLLLEFPNDYYGHEARTNLAALGATPAQIGNGQPFPLIDRLERPDARPDEAYALAANLKKVGLFDFAAEELQRVPGVEKDRALQFALADLHSLAGNTYDSFAILSRSFKDFMVAGSRDPRTVPKDFWYVCYPYNHRETIRRAVTEAGLGVEPELVASLIRMESRFQTTAVSHAGAVGLMQLMPKTAEAIARRMGVSPPTQAELFRPETNIRFGVRYLKSRIDDFGGDWFPAICSYNAGVGPVKTWWAKKPVDQPQDEFIEGLPYVDTRLYIKQILADYKNYQWIYRQGS